MSDKQTETIKAILDDFRGILNESQREHITSEFVKLTSANDKSWRSALDMGARNKEELYSKITALETVCAKQREALQRYSDDQATYGWEITDACEQVIQAALALTPATVADQLEAAQKCEKIATEHALICQNRMDDAERKLANVTQENNLRKDAHAHLVAVLPEGDTVAPHIQVAELKQRAEQAEAALKAAQSANKENVSALKDALTAIAELRRQNLAALKDSARLDWLLGRMTAQWLPGNNCCAWGIDYFDYTNTGPSRAAIDAARQKGAAQ